MITRTIFNPNPEQFGRPRSRVTQECGELCQLRKMNGAPSVTTEKPCTGLCMLRKQGKAPPDPALDRLMNKRKPNGRFDSCTGLCWLTIRDNRKKDLHLEKLQKKRPCVGICYLVKKKMAELGRSVKYERDMKAAEQAIMQEELERAEVDEKK